MAGIPELVEDGKSGLLFTPSNWGELADCIHQMVGDAALRERLTKNAKAAVAAEFDIQRSAQRLRELFARGST